MATPSEQENSEIPNSEIMIHFDLPKEKSSILKVIGVGGGGSNAVNHMFSQNIEGVNFIICNTDAQAIAQSRVPNKIQLGPHLTQGLGAGANPEIGKQATEESLEEIKRILEVNTKMAFITAGMGGGTGTGGAPIISKICKDLGILTVGIVTTPFAYEGKKRQNQAKEGIDQLKEYVDTLLVISNDKLRHQFGNLKMKDAFAKADNVLATAAKCITDVINSTGQINVDFADVCTVMRNGGVAILGSATAEGDTRAQKAIEEALNSPLLNDNDIRGAKWILININSAEGDHEFTMDEVEVIQNYLLSHAGDDTDVILGLGYDNTLERKIGITLIATGFEHKTPFFTKEDKAPEPWQKEEKIMMTLNAANEQSRAYSQPPAARPEEARQPAPDTTPKPTMQSLHEEMTAEQFALMPTLVQPEPEAIPAMVVSGSEEPVKGTVVKETVERFELVYSQPVVIQTAASAAPAALQQPANGKTEEQQEALPTLRKDAPAPAPSGTQASRVPAPAAQLSKPANIYAEARVEQQPVMKPAATVKAAEKHELTAHKDEESTEMQLVIKEDMQTPKAAKPEVTPPAPEELPVIDEVEEQKKRASERIQKLRNLSYNISGSESNNEFESVPAYIRRNLELYNTANSVENFYSNYTVKPDDNNNKSQISTLNTFLDGKKPD